MTMAERLKEKTKLEIAQHMLDAGFDLAIVTKITEMSVKKIKSLQKSHH